MPDPESRILKVEPVVFKDGVDGLALVQLAQPSTSLPLKLQESPLVTLEACDVKGFRSVRPSRYDISGLISLTPTDWTITTEET